MGAAVEAGTVAGAPEGCTHAIVSRYEFTLHPAAGEASPWHDAQDWPRMGAMSVSKTGGTAG
jgi:hypothetical protein